MTSPTQKLGSSQQMVLAALTRYGEWHVGCSWRWESDIATKRVLESLVRRKLVTKHDITGYAALYTLAGRKPGLLEFHRLAGSAEPWLPIEMTTPNEGYWLDGKEEGYWLDGKEVKPGALLELQALSEVITVDIPRIGRVSGQARKPWGIEVRYELPHSGPFAYQGVLCCTLGGVEFQRPINFDEMRFHWAPRRS